MLFRTQSFLTGTSEKIERMASESGSKMNQKIVKMMQKDHISWCIFDPLSEAIRSIFSLVPLKNECLWNNISLTFLRGTSEKIDRMASESGSKMHQKLWSFGIIFAATRCHFASQLSREWGGTSETSRLETIIFIGMGFDLYRPGAAHCMGGAGGASTSRKQ